MEQELVSLIVAAAKEEFKKEPNVLTLTSTSSSPLVVSSGALMGYLHATVVNCVPLTERQSWSLSGHVGLCFNLLRC